LQDGGALLAPWEAALAIQSEHVTYSQGRQHLAATWMAAAQGLSMRWAPCCQALTDGIHHFAIAEKWS
jgi:hypothetical protein